MTGMRPDTTGVYDLQHPLNKTLPDAMTMPRFFQQNGYRTVSLTHRFNSGDKTSDRVAVGRYQPTAPTDAYVRALAHTVPQIMASLRA